MFQKLVHVSRQRHKDITLAPVTNYNFASALHSVPLALEEFPGACIHLPIVFIQEQDKMFPNLMLGLTPGQNLCIDEENKWIAGYIPWAVMRYPFAFVATEDKEKLALCVDEKCGLFSHYIY